MGYRRIVGLGLCVVDHSYRIARWQPAAVRTRYSQRDVATGGMIANALRQAAALGCNAHVLSALGNDADGRFVRRSLRNAGVKTGRLVLSPRLTTSVAVVLVDDRANRRFLVPDRRRLEARGPAFDLSLIDRHTLLLVDGHFAAQALRAVRRARQVGATVIADFHRPSAVARRLLRGVDHAIVSQEYVDAAGYPDARSALRALAELTRDRPVVTLGARGGIYPQGRRVRRFRAHRVEVLDTTGAGDVFHGAFAAGLYQGLGFEPSLDLAARAAALACTALGGAGRLMTRGEWPRALRRAAGSRTRDR